MDDVSHAGPLPATLGMRLAVQALVLMGGVAALSWEILWQLRASLALGASALATAIVLAVTMGGMAIGSLAAGRLLERKSIDRPLALYGRLECAIGLFGVLMLPGFAALEKIDSEIYGFAPALAPLAHVVGVALLLLPPSLAMGATIPTFQRIAGRYGTTISALYGLNTAGAALGVLLLTFELLPRFGLLRSAMLVCSANLLIFALAHGLSTKGARTAGAVVQHAVADPRKREPLSPALVGLVVFSTGFATFGLEVAWFRSLRAAFYSTTETFAILLVAVLIPLAFAARSVNWLRRRGVPLMLPLAGAGVAILFATPFVEHMDLLPHFVLDPWVQVAVRLGVCLLILGPAILLLGVPLPWALEQFPRPETSGRLYALNSLGAVSGSLTAGWLLLPTLGFAHTAWLLGGAILVLAFVAGSPWLRFATALAGAAAFAMAMTQSAGLGRDRLQGVRPVLGPYRIIAYEEGPDSTFSVFETPGGERHLVIDGFISTSEFSEARYMESMGRLPMLLHPDPKRALVLCFGSGRTAHAVRVARPESLDIVEISRAVIDLAPLFTSNYHVLDDPRVHAVIMDARAWLRRSDRDYDVVTLEPMPPNFAGMNALYSQEFYEILAKRLAPGGVVAQWLPLHLLSPDHAVLVSATFRAAFPDSLLWIDPVSATGILLGRRDASGPPLETWPGLMVREDSTPAEEAEIRRSVALDTEELGFYTAGAGVISDDNQVLAYGLAVEALRGDWKKNENLRAIFRARRSDP